MLVTESEHFLSSAVVTLDRSLLKLGTPYSWHQFILLKKLSILNFHMGRALITVSYLLCNQPRAGLEIRSQRKDRGYDNVLPSHSYEYYRPQGSVIVEYGAVVEWWLVREVGERTATVPLRSSRVLHEVTRDWNGGSTVKIQPEIWHGLPQISDNCEGEKITKSSKPPFLQLTWHFLAHTLSSWVGLTAIPRQPRHCRSWIPKALWESRS
jgi:hypothetical protein